MKPLILSTLIIFTIARSAAQTSEQKTGYSRNIIIAAAIVNNAGPGGSLQYERSFSEHQKLSFIFPLAICYGHVPPSKSGSRTAGNFGEDLHPQMIVCSPGIRYYPTSSYGVVRYSLGASLLYGTGKGRGNTYKNGTNNLIARNMLGMVMTHAIHIQPVPRIRISIELALGIGKDSDMDTDSGAIPMGQAAFSLGYRF